MSETRVVEMSNSSVAANALGTLGTIFWCIQLVPQIWYNYRRKQTDGMPATMMLLWAVSAIPFGAYAIIQSFAIPLLLQPQLFGVLALISWGQVHYYDSKVPGHKIWPIVVGLCALLGGIETALALGLKIPYRQGTVWPATLVGVIAAVLLMAGFVPTFMEIWYRKGRVVGISFVFLGIDSLGAIFSTLALAVEASFDPLGGVLYILVLLSEVAIAVSHLIWRYRTRSLHRKAKELGIAFDKLPESRPYQRGPIEDFEEGLETSPRLARRPSQAAEQHVVTSVDMKQ